MKKFLFFAIVILFSLSSFGQYPNQSGSEKKPVLDVETYVDKKPVIFQSGNVKWIHDKRNKAMIMFKGQADSVLIAMFNWLERKTDDTGAIATPVVKITGTPIDPLTLFTRKELRQQENKKLVVELTKYDTYVVTIPDYTYVEDFDEIEYARYKGKKLVPVTPTTNQPATPPVVVENKTQRAPRSSAFKPRTKYPRN